MKIVSWNVNGIRSVYKKNFLRWLRQSRAGIVCLQEIKAGLEDIPKPLFSLKNYRPYFNPAFKKGYGGVAVFTKEEPIAVDSVLGMKRFDGEGRFLRLDYPNFILLVLYLPHGGRGKENLPYKLKVYDFLLGYLANIKNERVIIAGDFNIAREEIDLARPKNNKNNIMFTPEERRRLAKIVGMGFVDSFRQFNKKPGNYTWWPYWGSARKRNLGWRLDYLFVSEKLSAKLQKAEIYPKAGGSDHCPVGLEIKS